MDVVQVAERPEIELGECPGQVDRGEAEPQRRRGNPLQSVVAVSQPAPLKDDEEKHLRERQGQEREVNSVEPNGHRADDERDHGHEGDRDEEREPEIRVARKEALDRQERHVRTEPVEHRLTVREQSRVAEQQVEADRADPNDENLRGEPGVPADRVQHERKQDEAKGGEPVEPQVAHQQWFTRE